MLKYCFSRWIKKALSSSNERGTHQRRKVQFQPRLEAFEDRVVPTVWIINNPGDASGTNGTLRHALVNDHSGDTIDIEVPTITLSNANTTGLIISKNVTIKNLTGGTAVIDGAYLFSVFTVDTGVTAHISGLTIEDGFGVIGGGLINEGTANVSGCTFASNIAEFIGGAIYNEADLVVSDSNFSTNSAHTNGTGADGWGGGIFNTAGSANITSSTFTSNTAHVGGGIMAISGSVTVTGSTFNSNSATFGGGIYNNNDTVAKIIDCTFNSNTATESGGGFDTQGPATVTGSLFNENRSEFVGGGINTEDKLQITNSTFFENFASSAGGAISNLSATSQSLHGTMSATDITVVGNGAGGPGGGIYSGTGNMILNGDLIVGNGGFENTDPPGVEDDINGVAFNTNSSFNLVDADNTSTLLNNPTNQTGVTAAEAGVLTLADNGGPTETVGLSLGSYAFGTGLNISGTTYPTTDQVGNSRPADGQGDVGAYQFSTYPLITQQPSAVTLDVQTTTTASFTASASDIYNDGTTSVQTSVQWEISTDGGQTFTNILPVANGLYGTTSTTTTLELNANDVASGTQLIALNQAEYRAVFTNPAGESTTTNAVTLNVQYAPVISQDPANITISAGNTATFSATANSNPGVTAVQWDYNSGSGFFPISNGQDLPDGLQVTISTSPPLSATDYNPTTTLSVANVDGTLNNYQFEVVFSNAVGFAGTTPATVTVDSAPVVSPPSPLTVNAGAVNQQFTATAVSNPPASVQWYVSTNGGANFSLVTGTIYSGANTDTLTISTVSASLFGYEYEAAFTNPVGTTTTTPATLTVNYAPIINTPPASATFNSGSTATFTSTATSYPAVTTLQWEYNNGSGWFPITGGLLPDGLPVSITTSPSLPNSNPTSTLSIPNSDFTLNGYKFETIFTNSIGSTTSSPALLTELYAPIVSPPVSETENAGTANVTFSATANASPAATVQWYVSANGGISYSLASGLIYSGVSTDTLTISSVSAAMNGYEYEAVFTNTIGSTTSAPAILTVDYAPIITALPANTTVNATTTALFSASANSNPGVTSVQWEYNSGSGWLGISNGGSLPGGATVTISTTTLPSTSPTSTISIANTSNLLNNYEFYAAFTDSVGTTTSIGTPAVLTVDYAPIVSPPSSQTVNAGATNVTFTASSNANPVAGVQWYVSTDGGNVFNPIAGGGVYSGFATDTLTINGPVTSAMNGYQYAATFTNFLGSTSTSSATLNVGYVPIITTQPSNVSQPAGGTAIFTASANSNPAISSIQWEYSTGGAFTALSNGLFDGATITGSGTGTLTISGLTAQLSGDQFEAVFTNMVGSTTTSSASLNVETAPVIQSNPQSESVVIGNNGSFTATATGNPTPTVEWEVSSDGGNTFRPISAGGVYGSSVTTDTLTITNASLSISGNEYEAIFSNGIGSSAVTTPATLTVGTVPVVTQNPAGTIINLGGSTSFSAIGSGTPTPTVQWEVNENNGQGYVPVSNGVVVSGATISGATTDTLSITNVTAAMNGYEYEAVFSSSEGSTPSMSATLSVLGMVLTEGPNVLLYDTANKLVDSITPFGSSATGLQAAVGFLTGGVNSDLVVSNGPGGGQIFVYNGLTGPVMTSFYPFGSTYTAGVNIALGHVLSANAANVDIVAAPGGAGKGVEVFNANGAFLNGFFPFTAAFPNKSYTGGLNVAVGNLKGSGPETIVLGTNVPQAAFAQLWNYTAAGFVKQTTFSYAGQGAYVSTYAPIPGGPADLVVGTDNLNGTTSLSHLYIQNPNTGAYIAQLPSNGTDLFTFGDVGPVRVSVTDVNGDGVPDFVITTGPGVLQEVRIFDITNTNTMQIEYSLNATALALPEIIAGEPYNGGLYIGS